MSSSYPKRLRIQLVCLVFILYCIYFISRNVSTVKSGDDILLVDTTSPISDINAPTETIKEDAIQEEVLDEVINEVVEEKVNLCTTPQVLKNVDPNHTNAHYNFWYHLSESTIEAYKKQWQRFVSRQIRSKMPSYMKGKGVVFVAGNRDTFQRAITSIRLLRKYKCTLGIEVWHMSDEQPTKEIAAALASLNATPRDLSDPTLIRAMIGRRDAEKQFQIKAAAIINSNFKEVLYLDSDNIPASDPSFLFHTPGYLDTGALFWPDFWKTHGENRIFSILDIACQDEWEQESGQIVVNKEKSWLPLQLAWYMQKHHDVYFQFLNGDKDTFKYAWKALGISYYMTDMFVGMAGIMADNGRFCGHTMIQFAPDEEEERILFVHANLLKITDKAHFVQNGVEHPWNLTKHSSMSRGNTWIKPEFWISPLGQACMDFSHDEGEPETITQDFDTVLPKLQKDYFAFGGIGGETRT